MDLISVRAAWHGLPSDSPRSGKRGCRALCSLISTPRRRAVSNPGRNTKQLELVVLVVCRLQHPRDKLVDILLAVAGVAALDEVVADAREAADWAVHFEGPQELRALLEIGSDSVD